MGIYLSGSDGGAAVREQFPSGQDGVGYAALWKANHERSKAYSHQMIDAVVADGRNSEIGVVARVHGLIPESIDQAWRFRHLLMEM